MARVNVPVEIKGHRFPELDSMRGLAAVAVVLGHTLGLWSTSPAVHGLLLSPLNALLAGGSAVMLFFVLSGFVLTLPYRRPAHASYPVYLAKRTCRLYLPYVAALLLTVGCRLLVRWPVVIGEPWIDGTWNSALTMRHMTQHLLVLGDPNPYEINGPYWTLVLEMRISLLMPLIAWCALRLRLLHAVLVSLLGSITFAFLQPHIHHLLVTITVRYLFLFFDGAILAAHLETVLTWWSDLTGAFKLLSVAAAWLLFGYFVPLDAMATTHTVWSAVLQQLCGLASILFMIAAIAERSLRRWLHHPALLHLGGISYSLYLLHLVPILLAVHSLRPPLSPAFVIPGALVSAWLLAEVFHRLIERPSITLGRVVEHRLRA